MNRSLRTRLSVERLDDRRCPSVSASLWNGNLLVTATETVSMVIEQNDADSFSVYDNSSGKFATLDGVTGDVIVRLSDQNDQVDVYLYGQTTPGGIDIDLGGGDNFLNLGGFLSAGGTINGDVTVLGGAGADEVWLGESSDYTLQLTVKGHTSIVTGQGNDTVNLFFSHFLRSATLQLGGGNDSLWNEQSYFHERSPINLGDGNDVFLNYGFFVEPSLALGGRGTDTFVGYGDKLLRFGFESDNPF